MADDPSFVGSFDLPGVQMPSMAPPRVSNQAEFDAVRFGDPFIDAQTGERKTKRYTIDPRDPQKSWDAIPEGAKFIDPETREPKTKPMSENVGLGTQLLFDMATGNPEWQRKILADQWGEGNVRQDQQGFYVAVNGKRYRPNSGDPSFRGNLIRGTADVVSEALPVGGAMAGAALASPGLLAGAAGGALGYMGGRQANRWLLALAGYGDSDLSVAQMAGDAAAGATFEMGGKAVGKAVGRGLAAAASGASATAETLGLPALGRKVLGVTEEGARQFLPLAKRGVKLPPGAAYPGAPILQVIDNIAKRYDIDPVTPTVKKYATEELQGTARTLGLPPEKFERPLSRTAAVDYVPAGEALHERYTELLAKSNDEVTAKFNAARLEAMQRGVGEEVGHSAAMAEAKKALEANNKLSERIVADGYRDIFQTAQQLGSGVPQEKSGDLLRAVAEKLGALRESLGQRYRNLYENWGTNFGAEIIDTAPIVAERDAFLRELDPDIQREHPQLIRALGKLSDVTDPETGEVIKEVTVNAGDLHHIRSMLGSLANWQRLDPNFRNGTLKHFRGVIDAAMRTHPDPEAMELLDMIDQGYRKDMAPFSDRSIQHLWNWTESNLPPAGGKTAGEVMNMTPEARGFMRDTVGPKVWDAIVGADLQASLDASKGLIPGKFDGGKFASEFLNRDRANILADYPPEVVEKFRRQAQYVSEITDGGKKPLEVTIERGDDFAKAQQKVWDAAQRVDKLAKTKPIETMDAELARLEKEHGAAAKVITDEFSTDPLGKILTNQTALLANSAKQIIRDPQLLETAAKRFGEDSPQFKLLVRTYLEDVLTYPDVQATRGMFHEITESKTRAQQEKIFGLKTDDVITLAKNLRDILQANARSDAGSSILATTAITHPASAPLPGMHLLRAVPAAALRIPMSVTLDILARGYTNPAVYRFIAGGLRGDPAQAEAMRNLISQFARRGGIAGSGIGAGLANAPENPGTP